MALETWLIKVKTTITNSLDTVKTATKKPNIKMMKKSSNSNVGVLAFEIAGLMSKLLHLWQSLSDQNMICLRNDSLCLEGVRKIVSNDDSFLLSLACAEIVENLRLLAKAVSRISKRCDEDSILSCFDRLFEEFATLGVHGSHNWVLSWKEMETKCKKMDRYAQVTSTLRREMDELEVMEKSLKKMFRLKEHEQQTVAASVKEQKIIDLQQKIAWQKQEVKYLKERSLWCRSFDTVTLLLVRSIFTLLARINLVFGLTGTVGHHGHGYPSGLPRSLSAASASATVYPSENHSTIISTFVSGPLKPNKKQHQSSSPAYLGKPISPEEDKIPCHGFFELNSKLLKPPTSTLGAAALALHYANLIIVMEKMIRSPQLIGLDAKDDLYVMLPDSIRSSLRSRLKGVGFCASDQILAGEWKVALGRILGWLSPLAHNMIRWHSERSFEQQNLIPKTNVLLFQTLFFANKEKTEAAITELLVGLNYIWRFEREMNAKALFDCSNFNGSFLHLQNFTNK